MGWKNVAASSSVHFTVGLQDWGSLRLRYPQGSDVFCIPVLDMMDFGCSLEAFYWGFCLFICDEVWSCVLTLKVVWGLVPPCQCVSLQSCHSVDSLTFVCTLLRSVQVYHSTGTLGLQLCILLLLCGAMSHSSHM